jgi:RNA recognition motif-containing protein
MRDKFTGRSRGFAFITFKETSKESARHLTNILINPPTPHIIQNRVIEVREGDGGKPSDSFIDKMRSDSS